MTRVDQFESVFKAADKIPFRIEPVVLQSVLVATDLEPEAAAAFDARVRALVSFLPTGVRWRLLGAGDFESVRDLLDRVEEAKPDLIVTYRNLHSDSWKWSYSLGEHVDILTQVTTAPVLLLPNPASGREVVVDAQGHRSVMALTDHLTGDARLVSWAARFTADGGRLHLTHVEDERAFDYFMRAIEKIPAIDTDEAREEIRARLLKEPGDYIESCRKVLSESRPEVGVESHVVLGHRLIDVLGLVERFGVELLVLNTKDEDQLAMHGLAYPLAVELRSIPLLML